MKRHEAQELDGSFANTPTVSRNGPGRSRADRGDLPGRGQWDSENAGEVAGSADVAAHLVKRQPGEAGGVAQAAAVDDRVAGGCARFAGQQFRAGGDKLEGGLAQPAHQRGEPTGEPALPLAQSVCGAAGLSAGKHDQRHPMGVDLVDEPAVSDGQVLGQVQQPLTVTAVAGVGLAVGGVELAQAVDGDGHAGLPPRSTSSKLT